MINLGEYNESVKAIFTEQQALAAETAQLAMAASAHPGNPQFVALMHRQWELIQRMMKLNTDMFLGIGRS
jgi:hypothetical protein